MHVCPRQIFKWLLLERSHINHKSYPFASTRAVRGHNLTRSSNFNRNVREDKENIEIRSSSLLLMAVSGQMTVYPKLITSSGYLNAVTRRDRTSSRRRPTGKAAYAASSPPVN